MNQYIRTAALLLLVSVAAVSCNKNNGTDEIPDAVVELFLTGAVDENISYTLPGQMTTNEAVTGSYSGALSLLSINFQEPLNWLIAVNALTGGVSEGSYDLNQGSTDVASYSDFTTGMAYLSTSGTLEITRAEKFVDVQGTLEEWFVDGSVDLTLEDTGSPPNLLHITGTFTGVNVKAQ